MSNASHYEEQILKELRSLPAEALPKVLRLLALVREEFLMQEKPPKETRAETSHERTRQFLATSTSNWAQALMAEREDRV